MKLQMLFVFVIVIKITIKIVIKITNFDKIMKLQIQIYSEKYNYTDNQNDKS